MALAVLLLSSCIYEDLSDCPNYNGSQRDSTQTKAVPVEFCIEAGDSTKTRSSISASETAVEDLNIYAYYNGTLETSAFIESPSSFKLELIKGRRYNLYVLANMGEIEGPHQENEMSGYRYSIRAISDISGSFPMAWQYPEYTVSGSSPKVSISLERLITRIRFSIDRSSLDDFSVTAVKLRQGALKVRPFSTDSKAESTSDVGDGDYASSSDLNTLNSGGTVTFYALENCQGVLLPSNTDPEAKNPEAISDKSLLCTYLEMTASYSGQYEGVDVSSDNVIYRFYLGNDNRTDFNVRRNADIKVNLTVTEDRIFDESWKVSYGDDLPTVSYSLELSKSSSSLNVGGSTTLSATYYRTVDGTRDSQTNVTSYAAWTSSNTGVATVSGGMITAVGAGTATITATYNGYRVTHTVSVSNKMTYDLVLNHSTLSVQEEKTAAITARYVTYTNGTQSASTIVSSAATWTSSESSVATVSGGVVSGVSAGSATITAKYNGYIATCAVTVTAKPVTYTYKLVVSIDDSSIDVGETTTATATYITYANGVQSSSVDVTSSATWTSTSSSIASVSGGRITGVKAGTATITATYNGYSATATVTVVDGVTHDLIMTPTLASVSKGKSRKFTTVYRTFTNGTQTNGQEVSSSSSWASSNTSVATVNNIGLVTGVSVGTATITATYNDFTVTGTVTVTNALTYSLTISPSNLTVNKGSNGTLTATYNTYADGVLQSSTNVTSSASWSSSSTSIAGVSQGHVSGVNGGTVTITATYNGYSATATVTIKGTPTLTLGWASQNVTRGTVLTNAALYNLNDGTAPQNVAESASWTTSNSGVATVGGGTITAQGKGTATITVTYKGLSASCTVTVRDDTTPSPNTYVTHINVGSEFVSGSTYKLMASLVYNDGTVIEDVAYTWKVTYAQSPDISSSASGEGPILYTGLGTTYVMAVTVTTKEYYRDSNGNSRQFTIGTSFSHNVNWTP